MDLEKLVMKAKKGEKESLPESSELEKIKLYKMAFLYTKNKEDALDIVQETIYKALVSIHSIKQSRYFSTWITKILINTALDYLKKKGELVLAGDEAMEKVTYEEIEIDDKMDLYNSIDQLNDRYKTIIILRYYQDKTVQEIAEILEIPEGTVKSNIHRALEVLKTTVKGDGFNE